MVLFKTNTQEFEFDRHLEHMVRYQGMQSRLPIFLVGLNLALLRFSCQTDFSPTENIKIRSYLDRI